MNTSISLSLGITFVVIGAINVWLILQSSVRLRNAGTGARLIAAHRIGGYLFIVLFCLMSYFMVSRLGDASGGASPGIMIHLTLAMVLSPLLFVKVMVARYYKHHHSLLMPIGLLIFVLSFVLIGITAGPSLAHQARMQTVSLASIDLPPTAIDLNMAAKRMEERCSKCHNLDRIAGANKDARGWLATVSRMRALPDSGISADDARIIVSYLASQMGPKGPASTASLKVGRALVDQRCGRCHGLDRVYMTAESAEEWRATVARMAAYAAGSANAFHSGEDEQMIAYLSAMQTPSAVLNRRAQAAAEPPSGLGTVAPEAAIPEATVPIGRRNVRAFGFIAIVCLVSLALIVRRPGRLAPAGAPAEVLSAAPPAGMIATASASGEPLILKLVSLTQQTHDSKTLRFTLPKGRTLNARPGQFLAFSFLFDGRKVVRCYTICSSAARSGYIEITPKRTKLGCVSVFLNDRAAVGMTVEASGPFGKFCLDEHRHRRVVLLAAGSGITPMIGMLRYIDDLCLDTAATLLYCVRTRSDILFETELAQLASRLKSFRYHVMLSKPDAHWTGPCGHVSREFLENAVTDPGEQDFFLCGPPSFMDVSRRILIEMGVEPGRVLQESFGASSPGDTPAATQLQTDSIVEFVRSGKSCTVRGGQTLLEVAQEQGIGIPFSCRHGQCGTCKTKLLSGNVLMAAEEGLDSDARARSYVLTCVGRASGAVKLDA